MVDESENMGLPEDIYEAATELFDGDRDAAQRWLTSPVYGLGNARPVRFGQSEPGAREVRDLIGRLNDGIFS